MKLEVSTGEALDKLSILEIKCHKIYNSEKLAWCRSEYQMLQTELSDLLERFTWEYSVLRWVNESIWNLQDTVRSEGKVPNVLDRILDENDLRFRVKDRINRLSESMYREQKGYAPRKLFFLGHLGLGDHLT
jgi:hypothetical protein